jgi:hypothetical protein
VQTGHELHIVFQVPYIYDYATKLCRQQTEAMQIQDNANIRDIWKGETLHRKYKRLTLDSDVACDYSSYFTAVVTRATCCAKPRQRPCIYCTHTDTYIHAYKQTKQTPWPLVRKRIIPTERPPLVCEINCQLLH